MTLTLNAACRNRFFLEWAPPCGAARIWCVMPRLAAGVTRLAKFISVSVCHLRAPMNSPLCSLHDAKVFAGSGFDER